MRIRVKQELYINVNYYNMAIVCILRERLGKSAEIMCCMGRNQS
jgi:hypothetical protein